MRKTVLVRPCQRIVRILAKGSQFSRFLRYSRTKRCDVINVFDALGKSTESCRFLRNSKGARDDGPM